MARAAGILDKNNLPTFLPKTDEEMHQILSFGRMTITKLLNKEPLTPDEQPD